LVPSAEEATEIHWRFGALLLVQVAPELVEVYIGPAGLPITATKRVPSDEEATEYHEAAGALVVIQLAPELVEVHMWPGG